MSSGLWVVLDFVLTRSSFSACCKSRRSTVSGGTVFPGSWAYSACGVSSLLNPMMAHRGKRCNIIWWVKPTVSIWFLSAIWTLEISSGHKLHFSQSVSTSATRSISLSWTVSSMQLRASEARQFPRWSGEVSAQREGRGARPPRSANENAEIKGNFYPRGTEVWVSLSISQVYYYYKAQHRERNRSRTWCVDFRPTQMYPIIVCLYKRRTKVSRLNSHSCASNIYYINLLFWECYFTSWSCIVSEWRRTVPGSVTWFPFSLFQYGWAIRVQKYNAEQKKNVNGVWYLRLWYTC